MLVTMLLATFLAGYATGPAGREDLDARAKRLAFPSARLLAAKGKP